MGIISCILVYGLVTLINAINNDIVKSTLGIIAALLLLVSLLAWIIIPIVQIVLHNKDSKKALSIYNSEVQRLITKRDEQIKKTEAIVGATQVSLLKIEDALRKIKSQGASQRT